MCLCAAGRKWHTLSREEQEVYYEMAKREKDMHQKMYPNWSARDNYAMHSKRKKRKLHSGGGGPGGSLPHLQQPGLSPASSCSPTGAGAPGSGGLGGVAGAPSAAAGLGLAVGLGAGVSPGGGSANGLLPGGGSLGAGGLDSTQRTITCAVQFGG